MKKNYKRGVAPIAVVVGALVVLAALYFLISRGGSSGGAIFSPSVSTSPDSLLGIWQLKTAQFYDADKKQWTDVNIEETASQGLKLTSHFQFMGDGKFCEGSANSGKFACDPGGDTKDNVYQTQGDQLVITKYADLLQVKWGVRGGVLEFEYGFKAKDGSVTPWMRTTLSRFQ